MTRDELTGVMDKVFDECRGLREDGQKEYAHDTENAMANFERIGNALQMDRKQILWVYAAKHIDGIVAHINGHQSQRESVFGRINDLVVYLTILRGMIEEDDFERRAFGDGPFVSGGGTLYEMALDSIIESQRTKTEG